MPDPTPQEQEQLELASLIETAFKLEELPKLCLKLGIKYDNLPGSTLNIKAFELVGYLARRGDLPRLREVLARERPKVYAQFFPALPEVEEPAPLVEPPALKATGRPVVKRIPIWGWILLIVVMVAFLVWASQIFDWQGMVGGTANSTPGATQAIAVVEDETPELSITPILTIQPTHTPTSSQTSTTTPSSTATASPTLTSTSTTPLTPEPRPGEIRTVMRGGIALEQVFVPTGSFMMGSVDGSDDEQPVHTVALDAFWIDRMEVTNAQFAAFVADTGYETTAEREGGGYISTVAGWTYTEGADWQHPQGPDSDLNGLDEHPVALISWDDATAYSTWAGGRLPTEAEWEYAARGPESLIYPWGNTFNGEKLNYCDRNCIFDWADQGVDDGYQFTSPVGSYPEGASWIGALDMSGNVWEWVNDWHDNSYYARSPDANPPGPPSGKFKLLRGGSWYDIDRRTRTADRGINNPDERFDRLGFRVVETLSNPDS